MSSVIGDVLPLAAGVAISPMPIIAVILMLLAPRAGAASAGFLANNATVMMTLFFIIGVVLIGTGIGSL